VSEENILSKKKLGDQVNKTYDLLLEMIITLKLKPGEVIVEKDLEKQT
jgi:DNA-binding GntR family transcriptional regulator